MHMQSTLLAPLSPSPSPCIPPFRRSLRLKASIFEAPPSTGTQHKLNKYSSRITQPKSRVSEEDIGKPQIGVSSVWYEGNTCNMHLLTLSEAVREGLRDAGMIPFRFNSIGVSDAISMGTRGMC